MEHYVYGLYRKNVKYTTSSIEENLFYIGISSGDNLYFREKNHKREESNKQKLAIVKKYDFILKIFWSVDTRLEAEEREEFLIRWFKGKICNICENAKDMTYARSKPKKPKTCWKKHSREDRIANRDRNLTVSHNTVLNLIEEWAKNPKESQQDFAKRHSINRSKFKDWLRLYKPEYIGLTKKWQLSKFMEISPDGKKPQDIIKEFSISTGYTLSQSKSIYYKMLSKINNR